MISSKRGSEVSSAEVLSLYAGAAEIPSATLHEACGQIGALPSCIKPVSPSFKLCGPAVTVHGPGGDNLWIHRAIYAAKAGDVLVVYVSDVYEHGYWGEIMSIAAKARNLGGLVIDGCVRDIEQLEQIGFPIFSRGLCIAGTSKNPASKGRINEPLLIGKAQIKSGDLIVGDRDGVVAIPKEQVDKTLTAATSREATEATIQRRLISGESSLAIYGWT